MKHPRLKRYCIEMQHLLYQRNLQILATLMYKVINNLFTKIVCEIFHQHDIPYNLRNRKIWESENVRTVIYGTETITYRGPEIWKHVTQSIKDITSLAKFKQEITCWRPTGSTCRLCKIFVPYLGLFL